MSSFLRSHFRRFLVMKDKTRPTIFGGLTMLAGACAFALASTAQAGIELPPFGFDIHVDCDSLDNSWSSTNAINGGTANFEWGTSEQGGWAGSDVAIVGNGWSIDSFNMQYTTNPSQTNAFTFTNNTGITDTFTVTITTLGFISGPTLMYGSIAGGLTDNFPFTGATFGAPAGSSVYTALIDGVSVGQTLWDAPYSTSTTPPLLTASLGFDSFNAEPGPGVLASISIVHHFTLTAGDSVTINSAFQVIPGPGGLIVLLGGFAMARRRRR